ncbi:helix-turn-helix domain-containing protein [Frondihabitans australicus]|uniref:Helix-turn-helix protein n=1 Tax=Frondihabitans australicus TaxID=386892 RepID=A0A495IK25_9MICO|nr:helix-turn-helix transcriptional regulator [Frondihabitans australicus]RKR76317.1 helix-turn-helix protein [Frondihabitans australicus]
MRARASLLGDYLRTRRDLVQPEQVGLLREPNRRVPGLRREEVAALAGISSEYYLRLEQGRDHQPSDQVLRCLTEALNLSADESTYLHKLARPSTRSADPLQQGGDAAVVRLLERRAGTPAFVADSNFDIVASNAAADLLGAGALSAGRNRLVQVFSRRQHHPRWAQQAAETVAMFRMHGNPDDHRYQEIVGMLSVRDDDFRQIWARHEVLSASSGTCIETVEPFGLVEFEWESLLIPGSDGLIVTTFHGAPGTPAMGVLAFVATQCADRQAINAS